MRLHPPLFICPILLLITPLLSADSSGLAQAPKVAYPAHTFAVDGKQFLMDGKPYQIISGEQSNLTVEAALEAWPNLQGIATELVSPSCAQPQSEWMQGFWER
jgi:Glycosyl hydrolase catalytic core